MIRFPISFHTARFTDQMDFDCLRLDNDPLNLLLDQVSIIRELLAPTSISIAQSDAYRVDHDGLKVVRRHTLDAARLAVSLLQNRV